MKKIISLLLVVVLTATAAIGGTLAYLTDRDSEANVFTVGNVDISLEEKFEQDSELIPGVDIEKDVQIKNEGPNDAWVWYTYALPQALDTANDASANVLHVNHAGANWLGYQDNQAYWAEGQTEATPENKCWIPDYNPDGNGAPIGTVDVEGVTYNVYAVLYNGQLPAGETTTVGMTKVYLDATVDVDPDGQLNKVVDGVATPIDWNIIENEAHQTPVIFINAYAMQTDGFNSVQAAYAAFANQWGGMVESGTYEINAAGEPWDGTADTTWYNETDTEFTLTTSEQLAGLAELVDSGNTFAGKTVKLGANLNLYAEDENGNRINFNPIGHSSNGKSFNGTFDGQGHTIQNLYKQNDLGAWQYEGEYYALFAYTNGAEVKNLTVADAYISSGRNEAACVVGNAVDTTFSDISINNATLIAYNNSAGGVASECYGNCSFTNVTVDEDTVIGPLWGTYDVRLGGVVGMVESSDKVTFSNITVACQLDAINDVASNYQWYNYRYSGMLIGQVDGVNGVADPTGYVTCENVTVTYNDWVNYHYCEDSSYGTPSYASAGQYKFNRVEAGTGTDGIDLSTCDHDENETHNLLIVFDQLFGGGQGVSGLKTYNGVTVIYNNK